MVNVVCPFPSKTRSSFSAGELVLVAGFFNVVFCQLWCLVMNTRIWRSNINFPAEFTYGTTNWNRLCIYCLKKTKVATRFPRTSSWVQWQHLAIEIVFSDEVNWSPFFIVYLVTIVITAICSFIKIYFYTLIWNFPALVRYLTPLKGLYFWNRNEDRRVRYKSYSV